MKSTSDSTKKTRRHFSPVDKVAVIRRHLLENVPISDLCDEYRIKPTQYYSWQRQFFEQGAAAFASTRPDPVQGKLEREVVKLKEKLSQKDEIIAEVAEAFVSLKKELGES